MQRYLCSRTGRSCCPTGLLRVCHQNFRIRYDRPSRVSNHLGTLLRPYSAVPSPFQPSQGHLSNAASSAGVVTRSLGAIVGHDRIMMDRLGMNDASLRVAECGVRRPQPPARANGFGLCFARSTTRVREGRDRAAQGGGGRCQRRACALLLTDSILKLPGE